MSKQACARGSDRRSHSDRKEWSDRGYDDDETAPWHRGHHLRDANDRDDGHGLRDRPAQDWNHRDPDHRDPDHRDPDHQDPDGIDGLVATLGGAALAAGDASSTLGLVEATAWDKGFYSIAMGEAVFEAWAWSAEPGGAVAVADVFLEVAGADFVFQREVEVSASGPHQAWARAEIDWFAIDFDAWSPRHGPIVVGLDASLHVDPYRIETPLAGVAWNLAVAGAAAEAYGADTLSATFTDALAVENQFSFVQAMAMVAA
jgi:hypothetical protein